MGVVCSAPGKLILLGEYSVLFGHPALVAAVDRRVRVHVEPSPTDRWSVQSPGYEETPAEFTVDPRHGFQWIVGSGETARRLELVEQVISGLKSSGSVSDSDLRPGVLELDSRAFFRPTSEGPVKLGLGSSAALTVALAAAVTRWAGSEWEEHPPRMRLQTLLDLHRSFQGGRGSGLDLAASLLGGVVDYRLDAGGNVARAEGLELPRDLRLVCIWTGRAASTSEFLQRFDERLASDPQVVSEALDELGRLAAVGIAHLRSDDLGPFLSAIDGFSDGLDALGRVAGMAILSDEHLALRRLAGLVGVHYKPSGAGGGDFGIGFTDDPGAASAFAARATAAGFHLVELKIDPQGLTHTSS